MGETIIAVSVLPIGLIALIAGAAIAARLERCGIPAPIAVIFGTFVSMLVCGILGFLAALPYLATL